MLRVLNVGPLAVPVPEMLTLLGFWIGLELAEKHAHRYRIDPARLYNLVFAGILAGLIGARLVYAARSPGAFVENPLNLLALSPQMLNPLGGLAFAILGAGAYALKARMPLWSTLDALTSLFSALFVTFGLANFALGAGFGAPADLPWAIDLWGERRHPTQVYETITALLIAAAVWPGSRVSRISEHPGVNGWNPSARPGMRFWVFAALTAAGRLVLESYRGDSTLVIGLFRQAQLIAWVALALGLWQIGRRLAEPAPSPVPTPEEA